MGITFPGETPEYRAARDRLPLWNLFDLIPEGRGTDWEEQLSYS